MTSDPRQRALARIQEYGWNNTSFQTLEPYFEYWFDPSGPGVVAYYQAWGTWGSYRSTYCLLLTPYSADVFDRQLNVYLEVLQAMGQRPADPGFEAGLVVGCVAGTR